MALEDAFKARLRARLGLMALARAQRNLEPISKTLRDAIVIETVDADTVKLYIPHFWAIYVHDGQKTSPITVRKGGGKRFLAWFRNPEDDPRTKPAPVRLADVKYLRQVWSKAEFRAAVASGRLILARYKAPSKAQPFFSPGMEEFEAAAADVIAESFDEFVRTEVAFNDRQTAEIKLR